MARSRCAGPFAGLLYRLAGAAGWPFGRPGRSSPPKIDQVLALGYSQRKSIRWRISEVGRVDDMRQAEDGR